MRKEHVGKGSLRIDDAKTKAGIREVPIHPAIGALVARLFENPSDGFLVVSNSKSKYAVRSAPLLTLMEQAGVPDHSGYLGAREGYDDVWGCTARVVALVRNWMRYQT